MLETILFFINLRALDIADILLVAFLIYQLYNLIKGTNAINIFIGIIAFYLVWKLVAALEMQLLSEIMGQFISVGILALIIVFQQEIRQFLLLLGTPKFLQKGPFKNIFNRWQINKSLLIEIEAILLSCENMSKEKTGALIIITRKNELNTVVDTGISINAQITSQLIENIFYKNSPLHDGGLIISNNRITAARCILPATKNINFPEHLGLRHRAAAGITEISDTIAIIVSEQTGAISYAENGKISTNVSSVELKRFLKQSMQ